MTPIEKIVVVLGEDLASTAEVLIPEQCALIYLPDGTKIHITAEYVDA